MSRVVKCNKKESYALALRLFMASPSGLTSKAKGMDSFTCMCVRVMNFVQKKESAGREVGERTEE